MSDPMAMNDTVQTSAEFRLELAKKSIESARAYTLTLLEDLEPDDWFRTPTARVSAAISASAITGQGESESESDDETPRLLAGRSGWVTHIAWQVGHLAYAQYGLTLFRQRGRLREDAELMSNRFRKLFGKGSEPVADRSQYPEVSEIRGTFDRVHRQAMIEIPTFATESLDEPIDPPHAAFETRYGSLLFAAYHEMLHAGQIGLLRRWMGKPPLR